MNIISKVSLLEYIRELNNIKIWRILCVGGLSEPFLRTVGFTIPSLARGLPAHFTNGYMID